MRGRPTSSRRPALPSGAFVLSLLIAVACASGRSASHPFDVLYESGRYDEAAETFAADSALHTQERALFRAALLHATPEAGAFDPERARGYMQRLLTLYPETRYREPASAVLGLVDVLRRARRRELELSEQLERLKAVDLRDTMPRFPRDRR